MDSAAFKAVMSRWASGVAIITTVNGTGRPVGVTANSFTSLSLEPPLVLFCLGLYSSNYPAFDAATHFAVNVLGASQEGLSHRFAQKDVDRFADVAFQPGKHNVPLLDAAMATLECRVWEKYPGGDHVIIVGEVERVAELGEDAPLLYYRKRYHGL